MKERVVLAYAGGPDGPLRQLVRGDAEVVTLTLDLGQDQDLQAVRDRALGAGAVRAHVLDAREELVREYLFPVLQAGAACHAGVPLASAIVKPLIARKLVETAAIERAGAVAHGGGEGRDGLRIARAVRALDPALDVVTLPSGAGRTVGSASLWGRFVEWKGDVPAPVSTPGLAAVVELAFEAGVPVAINGVPMPPAELVESLGIIAGQHGVGRPVLSARDGSTSDVHETPAVIVLHAAHEALEALVSPADVRELKRRLALAYAELVDGGRWFTPLRTALDAFTASVQARVTGAVRIHLFDTRCTIIDAASPHACGEGSSVPAEVVPAPAASHA